MISFWPSHIYRCGKAKFKKTPRAELLGKGQQKSRTECFQNSDPSLSVNLLHAQRLAAKADRSAKKEEKRRGGGLVRGYNHSNAPNAD